MSPGRSTENLAYSWASPAILVAGKGRGGMFLFLLFLDFHSCSSYCPVPLFHLLYYLFYLFPPFTGRRHKMSHKGWCVVKPQLNQSKILSGDSSWSHFFLEIGLLSFKTLIFFFFFFFIWHKSFRLEGHAYIELISTETEIITPQSALLMSTTTYVFMKK